MKKSLAVFATHPIQYQAPIWRSLANRPEIQLHVFFGSDFSVRKFWDSEFNSQFSWDVPLTKDYPHSFLNIDPTINCPGDLKLSFKDVRKRIIKFSPDFALLNAYKPFGFYLKLFLILRWLRVPVWLRADATDEAMQRTPLKRIGRELFLRIFYSQISKFLAVGHNSRVHYLSKGVPYEKIISSPLNIDSNLIESQVQKYLPNRERVRNEFGFNADTMIFIFSGKLIPKKDPLIIPEALSKIGRGNKSLGLIVMGEGVLREEFEAKMKTTPQVKTLFVGFQNQTQLGRYYSLGDCLILPSSWGETWGLVVNEALQFGMPAIVSDRVGCRHDLIVEDETGFVFSGGDAQSLADRMLRAQKLMTAKRETIKDACRKKARDYSLDRAVAGILEAFT